MFINVKPHFGVEFNGKREKMSIPIIFPSTRSSFREFKKSRNVEFEQKGGKGRVQKYKFPPQETTSCWWEYDGNWHFFPFPIKFNPKRRFDIIKHGRGLAESTYKLEINIKSREKQPLKTNSHQFTSIPRPEGESNQTSH